MRKTWVLLLASLAAPTSAADDAADFLREGKASLDLRYRFENVEQDDKPESADANTLRIRLDLASGEIAGFSGLLGVDHVETIGTATYDDTRNARVEYPVIADPQGTDLNQAWLRYRGAKDTVLKLGRQKISIGNERFVGPVGWRQNEQSFDAVSLATHAVPGASVTYAWVDRVLRVFGPDEGAPPAELSSDSHLLDVRTTSLPLGVLAVYGYHLDFRNAPQLSADTLGLRYDGERDLPDGFRLGWAIEYARQREAGDNAADIDAHYQLVELKLAFPVTGVTVGREVLSGERGTFEAATNPAFQTPLATLHPFQGWADKFTTTPPAGVEDVYLGVSTKLAGWKGQALWHDFKAEATDAQYGSELDLVVSRRFRDRYELLAKYAYYRADELFADTRKFWLQLSATF
ncbi:MAG TPA: alginate export family protein [Steroidobacteraceae bacterium]|nr:alginate export family protein [Steroidobacteraceae bacterium]